MNLIKQNWIRVLYFLLSIAGIYIAGKFRLCLINDVVKFNNFAYIGTVATLIALMITIAEVAHSLRISKSIRDEARSILNNIKKIEGAPNISECLSELDSVSSSIAKEQYDLALKSFQTFRKICAKISPTITDIDYSSNGLSNIGEIELILQKATHTSLSAPLDKRKKTSLAKEILLLKQKFQQINPARDAKDATT